MAAAEPEKSRGLKFAEQQLLRHGWEHGKGLGRAENGISEALKVKVKCDKGGVGHKEGDQFTFHWWDHVFNKASSSLQVEADQNGIKLKKTAEDDEEDGMVSNKKPRKACLAKAKLYGCFVKSATLWSGQEQPEPKSNSDDDDSSSSEEEDQRLDLSSTTKLSDADLMKACGGRTAHKGARHGLTMSAKLARLEQQEAEFMAKWGKKSQSASSSPTPPTSLSDTQEEVTECSRKDKKKKKKGMLNGDEVCESPEIKKKKKKKRKTEEERTDGVSTENSDKTKRKHKKKNDVDNNCDEGAVSPAAESPEATAELHADVKQKKKKKKSSGQDEEEQSNHNESNQSDQRILEETEVIKSKKQKKKKSKKDKLCAEEEQQEVEEVEEEEVHPPKKKKKKSRD